MLVSPQARPATNTIQPTPERWRRWPPRAFLPLVEAHPSRVEPVVSRVSTGPSRRGDCLPAFPQPPSGTMGLAVMPGRLNQEPSDVTVTGLGQPTPDPACARGVFRGDQANVGTDGTAGEPVPVTDLDGHAKRRQSRDTAHTLQTANDRRELRSARHLGDRPVQPVTTIDGGQHGIKSRVEGQLARRDCGPNPPLRRSNA